MPSIPNKIINVTFHEMDPQSRAYNCTNDMCNLHVVIIDDIRKVVRREAIRLDENRVLVTRLRIL